MPPTSSSWPRRREHRQAPALSATDQHPNGLANGSDQVGRNYMFHNSAAVLALSREENHRVPEDARIERLLLRRGGATTTRSATSRWSASRRPKCSRRAARETKLAPEWTLDRVAKHAIDFWLSTEDLPVPENRVTVDRDGKLTLRYTATNDDPEEGAHEKLRSLLGKLDMNPDHLVHRFAYMKNEIPVAGVAHQAGTCRFGADSATSVAERRLSRTRGRQPLCRRYGHLPVDRGGRPGADRDGQRTARRRPPARADGSLMPVPSVRPAAPDPRRGHAR